MRALYPEARDVDPVEAYGRLARLPSGRPAVRLNMIASVDGAAAVEGRSGALGGPADKAVFAVIRSLAGVVLVGAATMRSEGYGPVRLAEDARARRQAEGLPPVPLIAVVTRACRLPWESPFFAEAERRPLVITTSSADLEDRARAAEVADVVVAGAAGVDMRAAVAALGDLGHDNVLAEGGPGVAAQLGEADLLDEVCLTLSPLLVGGEARRILDGPPVLPPARLALAHVLEADGYLFLRYRRQ